MARNLVVGANGSALDTLSAVDIATGMKYNGKPVIFNDSTKLDSEIFSVSAQNMIVIGNPCVNSVTSALYCNPSKCNEGYELGKAKIELLQQVNGKIALVVAGYSAQDTRLAAKVLANKSSSLSGTSIELQLTKP